LIEPKIRISELFLSTQGEGPKVGQPTLFLRTAGCNLTCSGWGVVTELPNGETVTGCDSPHSVFPQIFNQPGNSSLLTADELLEKIPYYPQNICLTGGEPLLQLTRLRPVIRELLERGQDIEVFTNGTQVTPGDEFLLDMPRSSPPGVISYVMDYKLESSGEGGKFKTQNFRLLNPRDSIKFVIGTRGDYFEAREVVRDYHTVFEGTFFMGVVWQKLDPQELISWMLEDRLEVRLNLQTQSLLGVDESERTAFAKLV